MAVTTPAATPSVEDPVGRTLSPVIGGPLGERAGRHRWWTPVRVLLALTAVCFALGMLSKTTCASDTWTNGDTRYTHMCYSDLPYLYTGRGFAERNWPYTDDQQVRDRYPEVMEYPVGISYWAYGTAVVTQALSGWPDLTDRLAQPVGSLFGDQDVLHEIRLFVVVNAVGFVLAALLSTWLLAGVDRRRPWDAVMFAVSPALMFTALINWDLLAVVFVAAALWAWARGKPILTGVMIGLGAATKLYPLFLLGAVIVICLRERRWRELILASVAAVGSWVVANAPAYLSGEAEWKVFWSFNSHRGPDLGSIWLVAAQAFDKTITPHQVNIGSWAFFGVWCLLVLALGLLAPKTPRMAQLGYLIVLGLLLINKVYSPQYVLWLLPLAVLARPRWRDQLIWQGTEILYFACVWWYLGNELAPASGGDAGFYWVAILIRMAGELYLAAVVVRDMFLPSRDPVRGLDTAPVSSLS